MIRALLSTTTLRNSLRPLSSIAKCVTPPPVLLDPSKHAVGYLSMILNARVYDVAHETNLQPAPQLSLLLDNTILLKREDTQPVFSFKIRGAYNKLSSLSEEQRDKGVVACSAGNHAQGVALSAKKLGCRAVIGTNPPIITSQATDNANTCLHFQ